MDPKYNYLIVAIVCALLGLAYVAAQQDWENILRPDASSPVHMDGKIAKNIALSGVTVTDIPPAVYNSLQRGDKIYSRYVTGNQKYVLVVVFGNRPNKSTFTQELNRLFKQEGFSEYYRKRVIDLGNHWYAQCTGSDNCPQLWIDQHCSSKVCLIQPQRKQAVIDSSGQVDQLKKLLQKYKDW